MVENNKKTLSWIIKVSEKTRCFVWILIIVQMFLGISGVFYAMFLKKMIDMAVQKNTIKFWSSVIFFISLVILQIVFRAVNRHYEEYGKATIENQFKIRLFSNLLRMDYSNVNMMHSEEWMNRLTSDSVVVAEGLVQIVPGFIGMIVKMLGALVMLVWLEPTFTYILIAGGICMTFFSYIFRKKMKSLHKKVQESDGLTRVFLQEHISSMLVVRSFVQEKKTIQNASEKMCIHKKTRMMRNHFSNICNIGFGSVMQGAYIVGAVFCGYGIMKENISYGTLLAVLQLISQVQSPFANITGYLPKYYVMLASAERLMEAEERKDSFHINLESIKPLPEIQDLYNQSFYRLILREVEFTYPSSDADSVKKRPVALSRVNMNIHKGDYLAITGASGCGKSTVLKILMCLYPLMEGEIFIELIDGRKIRLEKAYRRLFAYVPQGNQLMTGTIREIVSYSDRLETEEKRIWKALKIACADGFVNQLESGLDTVLGERGSGLSEGQMQRIAIARAIYSDHPILLLDEATSALDEVTEKQLLLNLKNMTNKTVVLVTHRTAILTICNKQIVCRKGNKL